LEEPWSKFTNFIFLFLYINAGKMSIKNWHQLAEEKSKLDKQKKFTKNLE